MRALEYAEYVAKQGVLERWKGKAAPRKEAAQPEAEEELSQEDAAQLAQYREQLVAEDK